MRKPVDWNRCGVRAALSPGYNTSLVAISKLQRIIAATCRQLPLEVVRAQRPCECLKGPIALPRLIDQISPRQIIALG